MVTAAMLAARVALLIPIWAAHRFVSGVRVRRSAGSRTDIRRVSASDIDLDAVLRSKEPVIIEGLVDKLQLPLVPDLEGLRDLASRCTATFAVKSHKRSAPYFLYVGDYGTELVRSDDMTLAEFLEFMFDDREGRDPETCTYHLFDVDHLEGEVGTIIGSMANGLARMTDREADPLASGIWIGSTGVVTPLHHDAWTGLLFQLTGSKRVVMFPPGRAAEPLLHLAVRRHRSLEPAAGAVGRGRSPDVPEVRSCQRVRRTPRCGRRLVHPTVLVARDRSARVEHQHPVPLRHPAHRRAQSRLSPSGVRGAPPQLRRSGPLPVAGGALVPRCFAAS